MPRMHRKHTSHRCRSWIHRRNSGGLHWQVQKIFQSEWSRSVFEKKGQMTWQQRKRKKRSAQKSLLR